MHILFTCKYLSFTSLINILIVYLCSHFVWDMKHVVLTRGTAAGTSPVCARGCVIRVALELYKKSLTVMTIVQTARFQRCSATACAARADWTGALERGRETSGLQHPVAAHLPFSAPTVSLFCEEERVWTSKRSHATSETETINKGCGERWHGGERHSVLLWRY